MSYKSELANAMVLLASHPQTIFLGQSVVYPGQAMFDTLKNVPMERRIEMPVAEDMQMGMSIGLSLMGYIPISIYPRMDFLILAVNQLVNHLDKIKEMSDGEFAPKVIIRTLVGSKEPLDGGLQHTQDHTEGLRCMLTNVNVVSLIKADDIIPAYKSALQSEKPTVLVEMGELYGS